MDVWVKMWRDGHLSEPSTPENRVLCEMLDGWRRRGVIDPATGMMVWRPTVTVRDGETVSGNTTLTS